MIRDVQAQIFRPSETHTKTLTTVCKRMDECRSQQQMSTKPPLAGGS
jgi:hypothetical protein